MLGCESLGGRVALAYSPCDRPADPHSAGLRAKDSAGGMERVTAPALVIHGTRDGDVPFDHGEHAAGRIPGAEPYWMVRDDHLAFWLSPEAGLAQAVARAFLRRHAR